MSRQAFKDELDDPNFDAQAELDGNSELNTEILKSVAIENGHGQDNQPSFLDEKAPEAQTALFLDGHEGYFDQHKQREKISTTPFTRAPAIDHSSLIELNQTQPKSLANIQETLSTKYRSYFNQWALEVEQGFNLLFYGIGSKRELIADFISFWDPESAIVVANGYNPALSLKELLNTCVSCIVPEEVSADWLRQPSERVILFTEYLEHNSVHLVLVIHNIDGPSLRDSKTREFLCRIVASPAVSLVASVDHINAPALWTAEQASQLNFSWHNVTNFKLYRTETAYMDLLSLGKSRAAVNANSVKYVLSSLTQNAQSLYRLLLLQQFELMCEQQCGQNAVGTVFHGVNLQNFYQKCVEEFIVSNELNFKVMLSEFLEHKMAVRAKNKTGIEVVFVPYTLDDLEHLVTDMAY